MKNELCRNIILCKFHPPSRDVLDLKEYHYFGNSLRWSRHLNFRISVPYIIFYTKFHMKFFSPRGEEGLRCYISSLSKEGVQKYNNKVTTHKRQMDIKSNVQNHLWLGPIKVQSSKYIWEVPWCTSLWGSILKI